MNIEIFRLLSKCFVQHTYFVVDAIKTVFDLDECLQQEKQCSINISTITKTCYLLNPHD